jgi:hypothetical protein
VVLHFSLQCLQLVSNETIVCGVQDVVVANQHEAHTASLAHNLIVVGCVAVEAFVDQPSKMAGKSFQPAMNFFGGRDCGQEEKGCQEVSQEEG